MKINLIKAIMALLPVIFIMYFLGMLIYPAWVGEWSYNYLHGVWYEWQTFNSAMIALIASWIALKTAFYKDEMSNKRSMLAAKALLPEAASQIFVSIMRGAESLKNVYINRYDSSELYLSSHINEMPEWTISIFKECIMHADEVEAKFLFEVLSDLQKLRASFMSASKEFNGNLEHGVILVDEVVLERIVERLVFFVAKLHKIFHSVRDGKEVFFNEITRDELQIAFFELKLDENVFIKTYTKIMKWDCN